MEKSTDLSTIVSRLLNTLQTECGNVRSKQSRKHQRTNTVRAPVGSKSSTMNRRGGGSRLSRVSNGFLSPQKEQARTWTNS